MNKKVILMILDGWGIATKPEVSAVDAADTPFMDEILQKYPHTTLEASGLAVGLPAGQMGNSEVGHMNLGAGRIVYQDLVKINKAVAEHTLETIPVLTEAFDHAKTTGRNIHFIGLVSDGGVHSHIEHLKGLLFMAKERGLTNVYVHAFTDGRDTDPKSGVGFISDLQQYMTHATGQLASVVGRFYAMDRDNRWERVKVAYDAMVHGTGQPVAPDGVITAMQASYEADVTDEFLKPLIVTQPNGQPVATIQDGDTVLCFNFRTDRGREITQALTQQNFPEQDMHKLNLDYLTLTKYDDEFVGIKVVFLKDNLQQTVGEVIANAGRKQIRIAETEKYPHVTFFFSGGREEPFPGEKRLLCPSPKDVKTYDQKPQMAAFQVRDTIVPELESEQPDFVCLNFANPDMVGHTGVFEAVVKAVETVDTCAQAVVETGLAHGYTSIIIADHGNAEYMINDDGTPNTAHTTNLVHCILVDKDYHPALHSGKLADIAPTILQLMGIPQPAEMNGKSLID